MPQSKSGLGVAATKAAKEATAMVKKASLEYMVEDEVSLDKY